MSLKKFTNLVRSHAEWTILTHLTKNLKGKVIQNINFLEDKIDWEKFNL